MGDEWEPDARAVAEVLAGGGVVLGATTLGAPQAVHAVVRVADPAGGGGLVSAYELPVELNVLALSGSLPSNWVPAFRTTQASTARVHVQQRPQVRVDPTTWAAFQARGSPPAGHPVWCTWSCS